MVVMSKSQNQLQNTIEAMLNIIQSNERTKHDHTNTIDNLQRQLKYLERKIEDNVLIKKNSSFNFSNLLTQKQVAVVVIDPEEGYIVDCNLWYMKKFVTEDDIIGPYAGSANKFFTKHPLPVAAQKAYFCSVENTTPSNPRICTPILKTGPVPHWKSFFAIYTTEKKYLQLSLWQVE